jgi:hypothetical protein
VDDFLDDIDIDGIGLSLKKAFPELGEYFKMRKERLLEKQKTDKAASKVGDYIKKTKKEKRDQLKSSKVTD